MKNIKRILTIVIMVFSLIGIFKLNYSYAAASISNDIDGFEANISDKAVLKTYSLRQVVNRFLGYLRIIVALFLVITVATTGYHYIVATPEVRGDIKKRMLPMIIGTILIFSAISIAMFITSALGG